ncbi:MAG: hypothetical protein PHY34_04850 [Patescibacteria group bacterium]|nr:hypothetical protein [Patescibacteria group bacterium]MDD5715602.1 hypothetical protein [Patescibacteria group bacterium]
MNIRVYFRKRSVEARLKAAGIKQDVGPETPWKYSWGLFKADTSNRNLVYCTLDSLTEPMPPFVRGLQPVAFSLYAKVPMEQNRHIRQGAGKLGESSWEVEYGAAEFNTPSASSEIMNFAKAYRAVVRIRVRGTNWQSVTDCYKKIRQGELGGEWKGESADIVVVGTLEDLDLEPMVG